MISLCGTLDIENNFHEYSNRLKQNLGTEGIILNSQMLWQMFLETGAPEMYLLYNKARKLEESHVLDDPRAGIEGHSLQ